MENLKLAYYDVISEESIKVIYYLDGMEYNYILSIKNAFNYGVKNAFDYDKDMIIEEIQKQKYLQMIEFLILPKIFWFTGQAGAGKTELAKMLKTRLMREQTIVQHHYSNKDLTSSHLPNKKFVIIDGDDIREIFQNNDYSIDGRKKNVDFVQKMCLFLKKNNIVPIVCMVSPFAEQRRQFIEAENGIEIYVHCNEIRGREQFHIDYYEPPTNFDNAVEIDTTNKSVEQSFDELWKNLL